MFSNFKRSAFLLELINRAPSLANLNLCNYESKYITNLIRANIRRFHSNFQFIDDLCAWNDTSEFRQTFFSIYRTELVLKVEHNGSHASFLDLDISTKQCKFIYKMFDKRDAFHSHTVRMPSITSNIPSIIFHSSTVRIRKNN